MKFITPSYEILCSPDGEEALALLELAARTCGGEGFLFGPRGGLNQNFKCAASRCGSRFNNLGPFGIERISVPSPDAQQPSRSGGGAYR